MSLILLLSDRQGDLLTAVVVLAECCQRVVLGTQGAALHRMTVKF